VLVGELDVEEISLEEKWGCIPIYASQKIYERGDHNNGVGDEVYQLQLVVVKKPPEEFTGGHVEAALEEGGENDLLLIVLCR
jgi:hypothetical protein